MKKNILLITFFGILCAQTISTSDLKKISNEQLDLIREELQAAQVSIPVGNNNVSEINTNTDEVSVSTNITTSVNSPFFGYNYFQREINFFDNIPAPNDYRLGPGDQLTISFWGERNSREKFTIDKEGQIFYRDIGFINLSNKTLKEAEDHLNDELSQIFSTLDNVNNPTNIKLSLGDLKSINVFFTGQIANPGMNLIHPFSDVFTALVQAGGVNINGSLRNVQIIRSNNIIETVDFYSFFLTGKNNFSKIRLIDGDIIHIPTVHNRVQLAGAVTNNGFFEFIEGETIQDIINFAGGLVVDASSKAIIKSIDAMNERTSDDYARKSNALSQEQFTSVKLVNGDFIDFLPLKSVDNMVEVLGRVKNPGSYPASTNLYDVLVLAGGFNDPEYIKSIDLENIVVLRKDKSQFYTKEFVTSFSKASEFNITAGDRVLVYQDKNYTNNYIFSVEGQVFKPGTYAYKKGLKISDAIRMAGGLTELSNDSALVVFEIFNEVVNNNIVVTSRRVSNITAEFEFNPGSRIIALPYENVIRVEGNVFSPGLIAQEGQSMSVSRAIELSGGMQKKSDKRKIYIKRLNGSLEKKRWGSRLYAGDTLIIPRKEDDSDFDITAFLADLSSTLANIVAILLVIDNANN